MADHITIEKSAGHWVVRAGGAVLGESDNAQQLTEGSYDPVIYIPRDDIAMAFLDKSSKTTKCPHKGTANYYSIQTKSELIEDAAWSYEIPNSGLEAITGHLAFYPDKATMEEV